MTCAAVTDDALLQSVVDVSYALVFINLGSGWTWSHKNQDTYKTKRLDSGFLSAESVQMYEKHRTSTLLIGMETSLDRTEDIRGMDGLEVFCSTGSAYIVTAVPVVPVVVFLDLAASPISL